MRPTEEDEQNDDPKMLDLVAKSAFLKIDDRTIKAFRDQGKTPNLAKSNVNMTKQGDFGNTGDISPLSYRSNDLPVAGRNKIGYLGTYQD